MKTKDVPEMTFGKMWRAVVAEFLASMMLIFFGCMSCIPVGPPSPLTLLFGCLGFGLTVMFSIQSFGHISGALMNPVMVVSVVIWKKMPVILGAVFIIVECVGGILGYGLLTVLVPRDIAADGICATVPHNISTLQAFGIEVMLSMVLNFIICSVLDPVNANHTDSLPLKFGLAITGLALAGAPFTGGSMNPVRSLGPAVWTNRWDSHWVYWLGPLVGGLISTVVYKYVLLQPEKPENPVLLDQTI